MAVTTERLIAILEARLDKFEKGLARAAGQANRQFTAIERRGKQMEARLAALGGNVGRSLATALGGAISLRGAQQLLDSATRIQNALKVAGLEGDELKRVYDRLFDSAQRNAAPLESLVTLYGRAAIVQRELKVSTEELLRFTDNVALALRVAGTDAQSASGALLQLSQALGSGVVRGDEFNSILEGALPIVQAAANGIEEAGGSVAKLRQLVVDGKVSSEAFFRGFEAGAAMLQEKVAGSALTVGQAFERLNNTLIDAAGKINETAQVGQAAAEALEWLAGIVRGLSNVFEAAANGPIGSFIVKLGQLNDLVRNVLPGLSALKLLDEKTLNAVAGSIGPAAGPANVKVASGKTGRIDPVQERIDAAFAASSGGGTVSLKDFAVPGTKKAGGSKRENEFARETQQIKERTAAIVAETTAMAGLNPLIDDFDFALTKAAATQELLTAASRAGIAVTPELKATIEQLAGGYATATAEANRLQESQDRIRDQAEDMRALGKDVMSGFISDLRSGTSAADALNNALNKVLDKLIDIGLNSIFGKGGLIGGGGLLGGAIIPGILHSGGVAGKDGYGHGRAVSPSVFAGARRYHKGGIAGLQAGEVPAILQRGEVVLPRGATAQPTGSGTVDIRVAVDQNGNLQAYVERTAGMVSAQVYQAGQPGTIRMATDAVHGRVRRQPGYLRG